MKILVAGMGNIFHGDGAFGCEVARQLEQCALPSGVTVRDFGMRSHDLAHALNSDYDAVILVDAARCGKEPGTLYLIEPETGMIEECKQVGNAAIQIAESLGGIPGKLYVVGCEPAVLEDGTGKIGLSERIEQTIPQALAMIESLIVNLVFENEEEETTGLVPV